MDDEPVAEVGGSRKKFNESERRAKGRVRLHWTRGLAELRKVATLLRKSYG